MKNAVLVCAFASICFAASAYGQVGGPPQPDPITNISNELTRISRSVTTLSDRMGQFIERLDKAPGASLTEKQQKLIMGLQLLASAEQILASRQRFQIELVERQTTTRTRLAQIERDITPQGVDRSVTFEGTTRTDELRENRRNSLGSERTALQTLLQQINSTLADTNDAVREAQTLVTRLRRQYMPELERELLDR